MFGPYGFNAGYNPYLAAARYGGAAYTPLVNHSYALMSNQAAAAAAAAAGMPLSAASGSGSGGIRLSEQDIEDSASLHSGKSGEFLRQIYPSI